MTGLMIGEVSLIMIGLGTVSLIFTSICVTGARVVKGKVSVQFKLFSRIKIKNAMNTRNANSHAHA